MDGKCEAKDGRMRAYKDKANNLRAMLKAFEIEYIPPELNVRDDTIAKQAVKGVAAPESP